MDWVLIIFIIYNAPTVNKIEGFNTEAACLKAAGVVRTDLADWYNSRLRMSCVPRTK